MNRRDITVVQAVGILAAILLILFGGCVSFKLNSQVVLACCTVLTALFAKIKGYSVDEIEKMAVEGIRTVAIALIINICIGMLISAWIASGTFSFFILLCLRLAEPRFFLVETFICCCIFSALIGSCWICAGTVGLALFFISQTIQINPYLLVGAIAGGSRFGACISPISDSANISRLLSGLDDIYTHIRGTLLAVLPGAAAASAIYFLLDLGNQNRGVLDSLYLEEALNREFNHHIITLLPVLVLCILIYLRRSTLTCLIASISVGGSVAVLFQKRSLWELSDILFHGYGSYIQSEDPLLRNLLSRGGISSMANVLFTLVIGMSLSGILTHMGILKQIVNAVLQHVKSARIVVFCSMFFSILGYGATGDSQPAKVLVSNAFSTAYEEQGLSKAVLSRSLEMSGFGEGMFPWTVGGVYLSSLFGIPVNQYWYCIFFYYFAMLFHLIFLGKTAPPLGKEAEV